MSTTEAEPIPWAFTDEPGILQWAWITDHLVARIIGREVDAQGRATADMRVIRSYHWEISDKIRLNQGMPRLLLEGDTGDFDLAERLIREHVAKCYDPRLGYRRYAGALAFTFEISTGERVDVSSFIGSEVVVTTQASDGSQRATRGDFRVHGYRWRVTTGEEAYEIVPEHVLSIRNRSELAQQAASVVRIETYSGVGRIYREDPRPGCTGTAGFLPQTVDHAGAARCPLHEAGLPDHLLH